MVSRVELGKDKRSRHQAEEEPGTPRFEVWVVVRVDLDAVDEEVCHPLRRP